VRQRLGRRQLIAGFEVSINCRFCVSTEADALERAHASFRHASIIAVNYASLCSGLPEEFCVVPELSSFGEIGSATGWLVAEVRRRARISQQVAQWHRNLTTQKPTQWGPATLQAVDAIVRAAEITISRDNLSKAAKPMQRAEYYAGLLCMHAGLLPPTAPGNAETISDRIRKRLDRGLPLLRAVEEHESRYPTTSR